MTEEQSSQYYELREDLLSNTAEELDNDNEWNTETPVLSAKGTGCIGWLEDLPLWLKLLSTSLVINIGFLIVAAVLMYLLAVNVMDAQASTRFIESVQPLNNYITALRNERQLTTRILCSDFDVTDDVWTNLDTFRNVTNEQLLIYQQSVNSTKSSKEYFKSQIELARAYIDGYIYSEYIVTVYCNYIWDVMTDGVAHSIGSHQTYTTSLYVSSLSVVESTLSFAVYGEVALKPSAYNAGTGYYMWYYTTKFFSLLPLWTANTPTIITSYCQSQLGYELPGVSEKLIPTRNSTAAGSVVERVVAVLKVGANVDTFQQYVGNYSYTEFQTNSTIMQESMLRAQDFTNSYLFNKAQSSLATASGQIAAFVVVSILFFLIGLIMEMMMAKTIRGPWQRLNKIQETTIKRFVPGGFLRLLGVQQISDLTLNMNKMKRIVLVQVEIKDFDKISFSIDPNRMLHVLNSVFEDVCPIVRRNQGFIDRYHTKGFSALFNKKRHAVTSALEMIKQARTLSERYGGDFPKIELIVSLQYGHALVGTVGEAERMDLILFGKIGDVTDKMMQLNKVLQTSVITSSETVRKYMTVRRLGMTKECNQIVEIYDANEHPHRKDTKADFEAGTRELEEKSFVQAHKYFSSVLEADANDETAQKLEQMCKKVIKEVDKIIETMETKRDFLLDPYMRDHLEQFCKLEMSSENLDLWKIIEFEFAKEDSPSKRRDIADTIIRDFVNLNGQYAVNISESTKKRLVVRMIEEEFIPPKDFFYDLQKEMVANISDTVIRYKKTQDCQIAYMKRYTENMELLL